MIDTEHTNGDFIVWEREHVDSSWGPWTYWSRFQLFEIETGVFSW